MNNYNQQCHKFSYCWYISTILAFITLATFFISQYRLDNASFGARIFKIYHEHNIISNIFDSTSRHNNSSTTFFSAMTINNITLQSSTIVRNRSLTIGIYVAMKNSRQNADYEFAQSTLRCYARLHNYRLQFDYSEESAIIREKCTQTDVSVTIDNANFDYLVFNKYINYATVMYF